MRGNSNFASSSPKAFAAGPHRVPRRASHSELQDHLANNNVSTGSDSGPDTPIWTYRPIKVLGQGSFGVVVLARVEETGEEVAIKRVRYNSRLHNRELQLMQELQRAAEATAEASQPPASASATAPERLHTPPNIVRLLSHYFTSDPATSDCFLHLVMSYTASDLQRLKRRPRSQPSTPLAEVVPSSGGGGSSPTSAHTMPLMLVKAILFQAARALSFLHAHHICHRDVKPANVLVDPTTAAVQLCDFGSAKIITGSGTEKNVSYICSRYYRAPELLFGALHYGCAVDLWSLGCIAAELLREQHSPLFRGCTTVDQMAEVFKVLGAPSTAEMYAMNPQCAEAMLRTQRQVTPKSRAREAHEEESRVTGSTPGMAASDVLPPATGTASSDYSEYYNVLKIKAMQWSKVLSPRATANGIELVSELLCYDPSKRLTAADVVQHPFFNDLFSGAEAAADVPRLPNGRHMPREMYLLTEAETLIYSNDFQAKMAREAARVKAAAEVSCCA